MVQYLTHGLAACKGRPSAAALPAAFAPKWTIAANGRSPRDGLQSDELHTYLQSEDTREMLEVIDSAAVITDTLNESACLSNLSINVAGRQRVSLCVHRSPDRRKVARDAGLVQ
jgi:hypothetical protein